MSHCFYRPLALLFLFICLSIQIKAQNSPYINSIHAYKPAPGQFIDAALYLSAGESIEDVNEEKILTKLSEKLVGKVGGSLVSLGAYGGYIIVGFDHSVQNKTGDYDFKVYGNATYANGLFPGSSVGVGGSCEAGIVMVSQDENKNGLPDDTWYELAGSAYNHEKTIHDYRITYYKPDTLNKDVLWSDNQGNRGYVYRNSYHTQTSYFPLWIEADSLVFTGARLPDNGVNTADTNQNEGGKRENWVLWAFDWGYADNHANTREETHFKIDWAVDSMGYSVSLKCIDFIKVYTAVNQAVGMTGEVSTEFAGIEDLHPDMGSIANENMNGENRVRIYPNPCKDYFFAESTKNQKGEIYSVSGVKIKQFQLQQGANFISLQGIKSGFYILKTEQENLKILLLGSD